jgi:hypothetical protein
MKELIEKIKELQDGFKFHCCQVTCEQIIGMIEDQESKPFNPLECGFNISTRTLDHLVFTKEPDFITYILKKPNVQYSLTLFNVNKTFQINRKYNDDEESRQLFYDMKIPNHRQGGELLQNLGVIE